MGFYKGQQKPPGSGRKKGTPNKSTTKVADHLKRHGANVYKALAEAINEKDIEMIKALSSIIAYVAPKPRAEVSEEEDSPSPAPQPSNSKDRLAKIHGFKSSK